MSLVKEIHLSAESGATFFIVEIAKERVVLAVENAARVKLFCKNLCESRFADTYGSFDHDVPGRLEVWFGSNHAAGL
jgi:hypothetical protein